MAVIGQEQDIIEEVRRDREDLARVLKKHTGIRKIVEDLYPDSAHFIYELLQNAEDTGATDANFILSDTSLIFEHNGRPFAKKDIYGITDIGEGDKGPKTTTRSAASASASRPYLRIPRRPTSGRPLFPSRSKTWCCQHRLNPGAISGQDTLRVSLQQSEKAKGKGVH